MQGEQFLKSFRSFGVVDFEKSNGNNYRATCPFSGKHGKFYVNDENGLWDSKVTGQKGNIYTFMKLMIDKCKNDTRPSDLAPVHDFKGIPIATVMGSMFINKVAGTLVIPVYSGEDAVINVSHWHPGGKAWMRTGGCTVGLLGIEKIVKADKHIPIYITEGEWDMYATSWLLKQNNVPGVVVAVPGAHVFKADWAHYFAERDVYCLYDNDKPGHNGETKTANMLRPIAKTIQFFKWNEFYHPDKYDVKDFIIDTAGSLDGNASYAKCFEIFKGNFEKYTHLERQNPDELQAQLGIEDDEEDIGPIPQKKEVEQVFQKWLKMNETISLDFVFGTFFANKIPGDPIWSFLVAPPGGSKTAVLITLALHKEIEMVSTLTAASLVSGMNTTQTDPSLIPKLNGRCLVVKDFTTVLSAKDTERDAIFGILRDAFDGSITKPFGNGVVRSYESKFGILGGVTPAIDSFSSLSSSLGERFLKLRLDKTLSMEEEILRARRAMANSGNEVEMNKQLQSISKRMLSKPMPDVLPDVLGDHVFEQIAYCARYTAKLRGAIDRDRYTQELNSLPSQEVATRLTKQYFKLSQGLAIYHNEATVTEKQMRIIRRIACDTIPEMMQLIMSKVYKLVKASETGWFTRNAITDAMRVDLCSQTVTSRLEDLVVLKILRKAKDASHSTKVIYGITDDMMVTIEKSQVFKTT